MSAGALIALVTRTVPGTLAAVVLLSAVAITTGVGSFGLTVGGAVAVYFVVWWTVLFAVLPFGTKREEAGTTIPGAEPGAPAAPRLNEKALWTTLASGVLFLLVAALLPLAGL